MKKNSVILSTMGLIALSSPAAFAAEETKTTLPVPNPVYSPVAQDCDTQADINTLLGSLKVKATQYNAIADNARYVAANCSYATAQALKLDAIQTQIDAREKRSATLVCTTVDSRYSTLNGQIDSKRAQIAQHLGTRMPAVCGSATQASKANVGTPNFAVAACGNAVKAVYGANEYSKDVTVTGYVNEYLALETQWDALKKVELECTKIDSELNTAGTGWNAQKVAAVTKLSADYPFLSDIDPNMTAAQIRASVAKDCKDSTNVEALIASQRASTKDAIIALRNSLTACKTAHEQNETIAGGAKTQADSVKTEMTAAAKIFTDRAAAAGKASAELNAKKNAEASMADSIENNPYFKGVQSIQ